jgi:ABC-type Na+ efflux pump permease subunit
MNAASLKPSLFTFTWAYALCVAIIYAVNIFITLPNSSAMGIIAMMAATMPAGGKFFTTFERLPTKGERFRFAVLGTAITLAISAAFVFGTFQFYGVPFSLDALAEGLEIPAADIKPILGIGLAVAIFAGLLVLYFAFNMGAKGGAKALANQRAK